MFSNVPLIKVLILLCFIAAATASPIFFGHGKQTQIFLTSRKDTVSALGSVNQIPTAYVKVKPVKLNVPVVPRPPMAVKASTPFEVNKLFNEMKNSKKPFMTVTMKAPAKTSMFPDPFSLFDDDDSEHIVVHVPYNVHTHNIHHHHVQTVPVYKHIPVIKHVPVHVVKEVAIPVHLTSYKEGWQSPAAPWW